MGVALPAAIGACLAFDGQPVVVIAGNGGFQLNIQESYFTSRYQSTVWGYSAPCSNSIAQAYGLPIALVIEPEQLEEALCQCLSDPKSPFLMEATIAREANAYPKMAFGLPISQMEPFAKPLEMEGT